MRLMRLVTQSGKLDKTPSSAALEPFPMNAEVKHPPDATHLCPQCLALLHFVAH